jgi:hypothetical protein
MDFLHPTPNLAELLTDDAMKLGYDCAEFEFQVDLILDGLGRLTG